jgi:hypothetical protein
MEQVLSHHLGPLPSTLAMPEGLLQKINKAALTTALQKISPQLKTCLTIGNNH